MTTVNPNDIHPWSESEDDVFVSEDQERLEVELAESKRREAELTGQLKESGQIEKSKTEAKSSEPEQTPEGPSFSDLLAKATSFADVDKAIKQAGTKPAPKAEGPSVDEVRQRHQDAAQHATHLNDLIKQINGVSR